MLSSERYHVTQETERGREVWVSLGGGEGEIAFGRGLSEGDKETASERARAREREKRETTKFFLSFVNRFGRSRTTHFLLSLIHI